MTVALRVSGAVDRGGFRLEVDLAVGAGEVVAVLGPNGAGKSTLLRCVAGLAPLTAGAVQLGSATLDDPANGIHVAVEDRPVAIVFQDYRLFPHLSVVENVAFAARSRGVARRAARSEARAWLARLDLAAFADRRPGQVSGGQAQRVALARALASEPAVLLLDEPLAALDSRTRTETRAMLRRHLRDFPGPVVVVTHDAIDAMVLAHRILVIEGGRVVQDGAPAEVARRPRTDYVARLVGLNLYAGTLDRAASAVIVDGGGRLVVSGTADLADGSPVLAVLRPAAVTVHTERPQHTSSRNVWHGTVDDVEVVADRVRIQVAATPPALVDLTVASVAELELRPGVPVWLSAKATEVEAYPDAAAPSR